MRRQENHWRRFITQRDTTTPHLFTPFLTISLTVAMNVCINFGGNVFQRYITYKPHEFEPWKWDVREFEEGPSSVSCTRRLENKSLVSWYSWGSSFCASVACEMFSKCVCPSLVHESIYVKWISYTINDIKSKSAVR